MDKEHAAAVLEEIAVLLDLKGENPFKSRAYRTGARALESLSEDLGRIVAEARLGSIPGLGEALQAKIAELVTTGRLEYHEKLRASFPPGIFDLLQLPGLGPKKVKALYEELQVSDIPALEKACQDHRVAELKGFGAKTELNILQSIDQRRRYTGQHRLGDVLGIAEGLLDALREHPAVIRVSAAGSLRRNKEVLHDLDLLASTTDPVEVSRYFTHLPGVESIIGQGETKASVLLVGGLQCDLRVVSDTVFPYALHHFTGSKEHNVAMRQRAISQGKKLSEWGLFREADGKEELIPCVTEEEIFHDLGLSYIPPELRENLGEIEAAEKNEIPRLVEWTDLKGTFHCHTDASDGRNTLREMVAEAAELGLGYLGIADHSKSSFQANGLSVERVLAQREEIAALNRDQDDVKVLSGIECDILKEGRLDYDDAVLAGFDYVVASLHVPGAKDEDMTPRLIKAMENPHVTMLGHPTGRLLLKREAYPVNLEKLIDAAAETGTWIELNANPYRLDLDWRWWRRARDKGVRCVINPDAHSIGDFQYLRVGTGLARKGWLRREDVANTLPWAEMEKLLGAKRRKHGIG
ncbi:MAG: DNA polymerase/3'-5' exonuclease PolX [Verrucomicrobium sp.]|nr:DNA polymerase/3'-5' exonuclease PolX [Verrucomicrobium sp.]